MAITMTKTERTALLLSSNPKLTHRAAEAKLGFKMAHSTFWEAKERARSSDKSHSKKMPVADAGLSENAAEKFDGFFGSPVEGLPASRARSYAAPTTGVRTSPDRKRKNDLTTKYGSKGGLLRVYRFDAELDEDTTGTLLSMIGFISDVSGVETSVARVLPDNNLEVRVLVKDED